MSTEINDAATRYERLRRMADDPGASDTERSVARAKMAALADEHGEARLAWGEAEVTVTSDFHAQLLVHAASRFGCRHTLRNGTQFATVCGPRAAVAQVVAEVARHATSLHAYLMSAAVAYIRGADLYAKEPAVVASTVREEPGEPHTQVALVRALAGFNHLGMLHREVDLTLPQLPARVCSPRSRRYSDEPFGGMFFFADITG